MKSFKEYLTESKQVYEFKIKLAGDHEGAAEKIKAALAKFNVESLSAAKRTPIQETQADFPNHQNINVTIFDATLGYPATNLEIESLVAEALSLTPCCVRIRNSKDEEEYEINHEHDEVTLEPKLIRDYDKENNQDVVGEKHVMSLLKDLSKTKTQGLPYKGINEKILAKKAPSEKVASAKVDKKIGTTSVIGSKTIETPTAR